MENQIITIVDEDGVEKQFRFLFAVTKSDTNTEFGFFAEMNTNTPMVGVYKFDEDGRFLNLETEEEMEFAQRAFNAFMAQRSGGCSGGCGGCHGGSCGDDCGCEGDCCE